MPNDIQIGITLRADGKELVGAVRRSEKEIAKLSKEVKESGREANKQGRAFTRFGRRIGDVGKQSTVASSGMRAFRRAAAAVISAATLKYLAQTAIEFQRVDRTLKAVFGSTEAAQREFTFIEHEAERLGLRLQTTARDYAKLAAAAKGTALEGEPIRRIFIGINEAATALSLTSEQTSGALTAIEQIISKGVVSAEELRGQLGERVPGAFQVAARAAGLTTKELGKQLALGKILAEDLLPAMAREFHQLYSSEAIAAGNESTAQINRFHNSLAKLSRTFGESGFLDEMASAFNEVGDVLADPKVQEGMRLFGQTLGSTLKFMVEHADVLIPVATALAGGALGKFIGRAGNETFRLYAKYFGAAGGLAAGLALTQGEKPTLADDRDPDRLQAVAQMHLGDAGGGTRKSTGTGFSEEALKAIEAAHKKAIAGIIDRQLSLLPTLDRNIAKLAMWRRATLTSLNKSAKGYVKYRDDVEHIFSVELARLYEEDAERQRKAARERLEQSNQFTDGFRLAMARLDEDAQSRAQQIADGFGNAFRSMEDSLVEFVTTGKLQFGSFVRSILADLARIAIRQTITKPLFEALVGGFSGGPGSHNAASAAGASLGVPGPFVVHGGGVIGQDNLPRRRLPGAYAYSVFATAPRYHLGGLVGGEVPAILKRGEEVLPRTDPRHRNNQSGAAPVNVQIVNQGAPQTVKEASASTTADGIVVKVVVDDLEKNGEVAQSITRTFGIKRRDY